MYNAGGVSIQCRHNIHRGGVVGFATCLAFVLGEAEPDCCSTEAGPARGGRIPQSIGATSPHLMCALDNIHREVSIAQRRGQRSKHAYRRPQSSHSSTGFHPSRLAHRSHFAPRNLLEKKKSSGLQSASAGGWREGEAPRLSPRRAPGLRSVKRCTSGSADARIVDPPSVAAAMETSSSARREEDGAV